MLGICCPCARWPSKQACLWQGAGVAVKLVVPATVPAATVAFKVGALVGCVIVGHIPLPRRRSLSLR